MKYLLFFTALIATANALDCKCSGHTKCDAATATCTVEAGKCYSSQREISIEKDKTHKATIKGCQDSKILAQEASNICTEGFVIMSSEKDFTLMSNVTCCDKDSCNQNITTPLNKPSPNNNLVCPSCFAFAKTCDATIMQCNNLQKKCFNISGTVKTGSAAAQDFVARGCAVDNKIVKKDATLVFGNTTYTIQTVQLQDAKAGASQISSCLSFAILLPSVLWFLLDRSLY